MKRERTIFKLAGFVILILIITFLSSCEKQPFEIKQLQFQGTCKILQYNQNGDWNGKATFIATDTTDIEGVDFAISSCDLMGGTFILNNDSSGRCATLAKVGKFIFQIND